MSIRHRGLRRFFEHGESAGLPAQWVARIRRVVTALNAAETLEELTTLPGWRLHPLRGDRAGTWSISITGNWRLTFRVEDNAIVDLDLEDYH